ncbi:MAG: valine--tRNA ligase [Pseudomonadota bacterium]
MLEKTFRPDEVEARQTERWESSGAYAADPESNHRPFTIMMPPPNVTGSLHIGHALTFTIQDILIRYRRMQGRDVLWQPGMDHAGIATQMVVERELAKDKISRRDLGREAFVEKVWQWKEESGGTIMKQLRHLGASADWPRERFTMDEGLSAAVRKVFVDLYKQGLIYRDKRLVNWDPKLHTAISDLEVEQREIKGHLWHIRYPIEGEEGRFITVATTRPETMLADAAVAVNPEDERYADLVGRHAVLPLVGRRLPIVADDYVDLEAGSGALKVTPAHDFNDFEIGRRHDLELINIFDQDAKLTDAVPEKYRGLSREDGRKAVVDDLEEAGLIEKVEEHTHMVPHGDRGGVPIEPWLTDQWYADAQTLAKPAIEAVEDGRTVFVPKQWENTYFEWMRNIQPWCISRQLWWGHQIPAWYGPDGEIFVELDEDAAQAAAEAHYGKAVELTRESDVLDTWFSSALWPFSTLGWPEETPELKRYYPGDVLVTGFDIIFFWVARMMMMGMHFMGEVPFSTVYIHGLVRDKHGQKMSKAKGNVIDPLELIGEYGCDAVRFTLAALSVPQGRDVKLDDERIKGYRNFATKLWNATRYALMSGAKLDPDFDPAACREPLNRWIVGRVAQVATELEGNFEAYRFNDVAAGLYHFAWNEFCSSYLEFTKPILQAGDQAAQAETRATIAWVLGRIMHLLHPVMPFITEELWQQVGGEGADLLIASSWPTPDAGLADPEIMAEFDWVVRLIAEVRAVRAETNVQPGAKVKLLFQGAGEATKGWMDRNREIIMNQARLEALEAEAGEIPSGSVQIVIDEATGFIPLAEVIDLDQERGRLAKKAAKLDSDLAKLDKKLSNPKFLANAPAEVVAQNKELREDLAQKRQSLAAALERLPAA